MFHDQMHYNHTPGIYARGYIALVFQFVFLHVRTFVCLFVCYLLSVMQGDFTSKLSVKVSLGDYISPTTHQKAFVFGPWVLRGSASVP